MSFLYTHAISYYLWVAFVIFSLLILYGDTLPRKRVCVIGAGRAGLAAIKKVAERTDAFELIAFEKNWEVGGLWIYRDSEDLDEYGWPKHSGIYKHLRTNTIRGYMLYTVDDPVKDPGYFEKMTHEGFLEYLKNYANEFDLRKYIHFNTLVTKVIPIKGNGDWRTTMWHMEIHSLETNETNAIICDAVMVCNGHHSKQNVPDIPGMETFTGQKLHSGSYRIPDNFTSKTVIVLGAGASGVDIARDLSSYAKKVYLSHRHEQKPKNVEVVRGVIAANGSEFILQDNSTIVADSFIFCTGFLYDYPFLDERSGISVVKNGVCPLYYHEYNAVYPSMAFIGLHFDTLFGQTCIYQSGFFLDVLQEKKQLPVNRLEDCQIQ